ncbi:MFS transporter [Kribbella solani]|uniref:MFS transporter n=1 Tax=Kribbella solani TaxID=236067 RepID=UPI0029A89C25|nr:MFS transporter [Kribbella solani]MDX2971464.1 MFS transporter [Kribbella solani]
MQWVIGAYTLCLATLSLSAGALGDAQTFHEPRERGRVIAGAAMAGGLAGVVGPTAGGLLIALAGWQAIFLVNLPIGAAILWMGARSVSESADPEHASLDR